jgi:hypothetical protein
VIALPMWFCVAMIGGASGCFRMAIAPVVAATVWTLTALVLLACWKIRPVRDWAMTVGLERLLLLHLTRFVGIYFLVLCRRHELPEAFAAPAGLGDIAVATMAALLLAVPKFRGWRTLLLFWNTIGLIDIVFVVFTALRIGSKDWQSMAPLRELPLSLLPTFLVPLIITSHVLIFMRAARLRVKLNRRANRRANCVNHHRIASIT